MFDRIIPFLSVTLGLSALLLTADPNAAQAQSTNAAIPMTPSWIAQLKARPKTRRYKIPAYPVFYSSPAYSSQTNAPTGAYMAPGNGNNAGQQPIYQRQYVPAQPDYYQARGNTSPANNKPAFARRIKNWWNQNNSPAPTSNSPYTATRAAPQPQSQFETQPVYRTMDGNLVTIENGIPSNIAGAGAGDGSVARLSQPDSQNALRQFRAAPVAKKPKARAEGMTNPKFLPQIVDYITDEKPGTIIVNTDMRFLYLIMENGKARRYGVGVGREGFEWSGTHEITRRAEWPSWHPPKEMIEREKKKGHILPKMMPGGENNPLGARALYIGDTLYRIHGTNQPWSIGTAASSGCIRLRNKDVIDLYERVSVGNKVVVL